MAESPRSRNQAIGAKDAHGSHSENGEVKASVEGVKWALEAGRVWRGIGRPQVPHGSLPSCLRRTPLAVALLVEVVSRKMPPTGECGERTGTKQFKGKKLSPCLQVK